MCRPATKNSGAYEGAPPPTSPPVVRGRAKGIAAAAAWEPSTKEAAAAPAGEPSVGWLLAVLNEYWESGVEKRPEGGERSSKVNTAAGG